MLSSLEKPVSAVSIKLGAYQSELGAEQLGILQSLMVTCRIQGINPYHYLVDVLQSVALHPAS